MDVTYSHSVGIKARVTTTSSGQTRLRVHRSDEHYGDDPQRLTVAWDHGLNGSDNACAAIAAYVTAHLDAGHDSWDARWRVAGASDREWIAVADRS